MPKYWPIKTILSNVFHISERQVLIRIFWCEKGLSFEASLIQIQSSQKSKSVRVILYPWHLRVVLFRWFVLLNRQVRWSASIERPCIFVSDRSFYCIECCWDRTWSTAWRTCTALWVVVSVCIWILSVLKITRSTYFQFLSNWGMTFVATATSFWLHFPFCPT